MKRPRPGLIGTWGSRATTMALAALSDALKKATGEVDRASSAFKSVKPFLQLGRCDESRHNVKRYDQVQRARKLERARNRMMRVRYRRDPGKAARNRERWYLNQATENS